MPYRSSNSLEKKEDCLQEANPEKRRKFIKVVSCIPRAKLVYVDESGIDAYPHRPYARAQRGTPIVGAVPGRRSVREGCIAAKCGAEILTPVTFQGTADTELFNSWVEKFLVPELGPKQVEVKDNASIQQSVNPPRINGESGFFITVLPPYPPDLNPI